MNPDPTLNEAQEILRQWADARGILAHSTPQAQALKLVSEVGELADDLVKGNDPTDALGDVFVCLTPSSPHGIRSKTGRGAWSPEAHS
jgi:hypothetical protein